MDMGNCGMTKPGNEIMTRSNNVGTMNGDCLNGGPKNLRLEVLEYHFDFWEFRHKNRSLNRDVMKK